MSDKVRINPIPLFDILRFANTAKRREKKIEKTEEGEIRADWNINRKAEELHPESLSLIIDRIVDHAESGAKTYVLKKKDGSPLPFFRAGQYLSISLKIDGSLLTRAYSLSSSPMDAIKGEYAVTIGNTPSGFASPRILSNWKVGDEVISSPPLGDFYYEELRDERLVLALAGGSGITPFLSMAKAIEEKSEDFSLTILYGSKTKESILFYDELEEISGRDKRINVVYVLSDEEKEGFEKGFINDSLIKKYAPEDEKYSLFFSGPKAMYEYLQKEVKDKNLRHEGISPSPKDGEEKTYIVKVKSLFEEWTIKASNKEPLLTALERAGIKTQSRCRSGVCSWCRTHLLSGEVYIPKESENRRKGDIDHNYIHPCVTYPESDITLEIY